MRNLVVPPYGLGLNTTMQTVATVVLWGGTIALLLYAYRLARQERSPFPLLLVLAVAAGSLIEPLYDIAYHLFWLDHGRQWTLFTAFAVLRPSTGPAVRISALDRDHGRRTDRHVRRPRGCPAGYGDPPGPRVRAFMVFPANFAWATIGAGFPTLMAINTPDPSTALMSLTVPISVMLSATSLR